MTKIGTVNVYWRTLDIHATTGEILDVSRTSETHITGNANVNGGQISSRTDHYQQLFIRDADGNESDLEFEARVGFRPGQTATFLWATPAGADKGKYIGVYNNTSGKMNTIRKGNNDMACIPFYNYLMIVAVFIAVFNIVGEGLAHWLWFGLGVGFVVFVFLCQKKLMDDVAGMMKSYGTKPSQAIAAD